MRGEGRWVKEEGEGCVWGEGEGWVRGEGRWVRG